MRDLSQFIGIPYLDKGTDPKVGLDCWQLVKYFYRVIMGKDVPSYMEFYNSGRSIDDVSDAIEKNLAEWTKVESPAFGDVVVFRLYGQPWHTGICVGAGKMLHTDEGHSSVIESYDGIRWRNRIFGYYRWNS